MNLRMEILGFEGCPHLEAAEIAAREAIEGLGVTVEMRTILLADDREARDAGFLGSPSIRVEGRDVEGRTGPVTGLCCRVYPGGAGAPPRWMIEAALIRAIRPRGILFLCVANSARSQMAEGIARSLVPGDVEIFSAGSAPGRLNPLAVQALAEIGIDISRHRSKGLGEIPADRVDVVITLCAEEVCPAWFGRAHRVHWGLPDPAAVAPDGDAAIGAFREVRDELFRRLSMVFGA